MVSAVNRLGCALLLGLVGACGDDTAGTGSGSSSGSSSSGGPGPSSSSISNTTLSGTGTGSGSQGSGSVTTEVLDDTGTDTSTGSSTGAECEEGCPVDQHCEVGECVWDQGAVIWTETFDTMIPDGPDTANAVAVDSLDEIVVVGGLAVADDMGVLIPGAFDVGIRKYASDGTPLWSTSRPQGIGVDVTTTDGDDALIAIGSFGPGSESAVQYSADGDEQWTLTDTGAIADGIEAAPDGSFFIVGWSPGADPAPWAVQYTPLGGVLWQANFMAEVGRQRRVVSAPDGLSLGLVGSNIADVDGMDRTEEWLEVWPLDPGTGSPGPAPTVDQHSVSAMDIAAAYANGIAFMDDGDIVVVGNELTPTQSWNITLTRYDPDGREQWREVHNSPADAGDGGFDVAVDGEQNIVIVGAIERPDLGQGQNMWLAKYDATGALVWSREHDQASLDDAGNGVAIDSQDNIVVVGYSDAGDGNGPSMWIRKYAP